MENKSNQKNISIIWKKWGGGVVATLAYALKKHAGKVTEMGRAAGWIMNSPEYEPEYVSFLSIFFLMGRKRSINFRKEDKELMLVCSISFPNIRLFFKL